MSSSSSSGRKPKRPRSPSLGNDEFGLPTDPSKRFAQASEKETQLIQKCAAEKAAKDDETRYVGKLRVLIDTATYGQVNITEVVLTFFGPGDLACAMICKALEVPPFLVNTREKKDYLLYKHPADILSPGSNPNTDLALATLFDPSKPIPTGSTNLASFMYFICECIRTGCEDAVDTVVALMADPTIPRGLAQTRIDSAFQQALTHNFFSGCRFAMTTPLLRGVAFTDLDYHLIPNCHRNWDDELLRKLLLPELHCRRCPTEGCRAVEKPIYDISSQRNWRFLKPSPKDGEKDIECLCRCHEFHCKYSENALSRAVYRDETRDHFESLFRAGYLPSLHTWYQVHWSESDVAFLEAARACNIRLAACEQEELRRRALTVECDCAKCDSAEQFYDRLVETGFIKADEPLS